MSERSSANTHSGQIRVLPASVVARIAAGEVITRPRAAVRELIDNALDAGATRVEVELEGGGYDLLAVHDDGVGISAEDAPLVLTRHATSKLAGDALEGVTTLGFRGEALASLAAVARVEIRSRRTDATAGVRISAAPEVSPEVAWIARQPGTSVEARALFRGSPVRRRVADPAGEARAIRALVGALAVAWPEVAFSLRIDGRLALATPGGALDDALLAVHGSELAGHLLHLGPLAGDGYELSGAVSGPGASSGGRDGVILTVNRRVADVVELRRAIERAYHDILPRQRRPYVALSLAIDPERVDVNVHPAKERVVVLGAPEIAVRLERELREVLGRTAHRVNERRSLALELGRLSAGGARESGPGYAAWSEQIVEAGALPRLRIVGHVEQTLIVCESAAGTLLVDQHRAHERVIFERLLEGESRLADPAEPVTLTIEQLDLLEGQARDLEAAGWRWSDLGEGRIIVGATPEDLTPADLPDVLERFAAESTHSIFAAVACHAAIRKRRPLTPAAAGELLAALTATSAPTTCPHGQPIVIALDRAFLERQFGWR